MNPLCIDLYCGLGGWSAGFLAEGYDCVGFDLERHSYGTGGYPGRLVLQDVLTLHGSQFRHATVIVASPPCEAYSYRAMPWKRAKALPPPDNTLFDACFRIQSEASEAAGQYIPLVIENVKGAQRWVGRAKWHYGSYYLWGDVPALMPRTFTTRKFNPHSTKNNGGSWFAVANKNGQNQDGWKVPGIKLSEVGFNVAAAQRYRRQRDEAAGVKRRSPGHYRKPGSGPEAYSSRSDSRKAASAKIAKIPFPLAQWIARCYKP